MADEPHRCRLCTANDHEALVEHVASEMWRSLAVELSWERADYWRPIYRGLAERALASLRG